MQIRKRPHLEQHGIARFSSRFCLVGMVSAALALSAWAQEPLSLSAPSNSGKSWLLESSQFAKGPAAYRLSIEVARSDADFSESFEEYGQPDYLGFDSGNPLPADVVDSLPPPRVHRLLPANISFMEKALWGEDGFMRTSGIVPALTPEERENELGIRRSMLSLHQIGGFTSLGLMMATAYFGQRVIDNPRSRSLRNDHQTFVAATIATYSATGLLAILSPPPLIRRNEFSTTTIHKTLAWVHAIGMIVTPILGSMIGRQRDSEKAHIHQIAGYFTTATFAASMITVTF